MVFAFTSYSDSKFLSMATQLFSCEETWNDPKHLSKITVCYKSRNLSLQEIRNYMTKSHTDVKMNSKLFILPPAHEAKLH